MAFDIFSGERCKGNYALSSTIGSDDPLIWTPSAVKSELGRILTIVDAVNFEVSQAVGEKKASDAEWKIWRQFYDTAHKYLTGASRLWGSNVVVARTYETEANKWHTLLMSRGVKAVGPANQGAGRDPKRFFTTTNLALAACGVFATSLLINAVKK